MLATAPTLASFRRTALQQAPPQSFYTYTDSDMNDGTMLAQALSDNDPLTSISYTG